MEKEIDFYTGWKNILKKRESVGAKAKELILESEEGICSYPKGYCTQELYLCKTCNKTPEGSGICVGCYLTCHIDHEVVELGPKGSFRCDCGNPRMSNSCTFIDKPEENSQNLYNHNFIGKFCICSQADSEDRESEMYMCINCFDWYHSDCIQLSNSCHNHSVSRYENIPGIPEDCISQYYFLCCSCVKNFKFIPAGYLEYIYFESGIKRGRQEECPLENKDLTKEFPYHIFISEDWVQDRCVCEKCEKLGCIEVFKKADEIESKKGLLERINEESEKIFLREEEEGNQEEDDKEEAKDLEIGNYSHETQIEIANGIRVLKDTFGEIGPMFNGTVEVDEIVEFFQKRLRDNYEAYKKTKLYES
jgi:hypothetical protein